MPRGLGYNQTRDLFYLAYNKEINITADGSVRDRPKGSENPFSDGAEGAKSATTLRQKDRTLTELWKTARGSTDEAIAEAYLCLGE